MEYEQARLIQPGQRIVYLGEQGERREAAVTGRVHVFNRRRGRVVFVPVAGELVVHTRIVARA